MATSITFEILAYQNRTRDYAGKLYRFDGTTPEFLQNTDKLRCKLGRAAGAAPDLDLLSGVSTANGSTVTVTDVGSAEVPAAYTLRLAQGDLAALSAGTYTAEVLAIDDSETSPADAAKLVALGTVHVIGTLGGNLGLGPP